MSAREPTFAERFLSRFRRESRDRRARAEADRYTLTWWLEQVAKLAAHLNEPSLALALGSVLALFEAGRILEAEGRLAELEANAPREAGS